VPRFTRNTGTSRISNDGTAQLCTIRIVDSRVSFRLAVIAHGARHTGQRFTHVDGCHLFSRPSFRPSVDVHRRRSSLARLLVHSPRRRRFGDRFYPGEVAPRRTNPRDWPRRWRAGECERTDRFHRKTSERNPFPPHSTDHTAVMPHGWEGNRRSGVAQAMRHRLKWFIRLGVQGLMKGGEHPAVISI